MKTMRKPAAVIATMALVILDIEDPLPGMIRVDEVNQVLADLRQGQEQPEK